MKIGDVYQMGGLLTFTDEQVEVLVDKVSDGGSVGEGDLRLLGVRIGRVHLARKNDSVEVTNVN